MDLPSITFVVITMNRREDLTTCLKSLFAMEYPNLEILVVDNGSHDGTPDMVRRDFPEAVLVVNATNRGVAGGRNDGIAAAGGDLIAFLDDDATMEDTRACYRIAEYFSQNPKLGCLCFAMLDPETREVAPKTIPRRDKKVPTEDEVLCGHFLGGGSVLRAEMLQQTGVFWEKLNPFGSEEFDLSFRILEADYDILWTRAVPMIHYETPNERPSRRRIYFEVRNRPWVALKSLPLHCVATYATAWWGYMLLTALRSGHLGTWFKAVGAFLAGVPDVWRQRKRISSRTIAKLKKYSGPLYY
ncbi:MAG: glycosyltransferase [Acidobacteriota bacterium]|nr:glycosyltransferase [Acidobacteriota bacterium]